MKLHKAVRFLSRNHEGKGESGIIHSKGWKKKKKSIRNTLPGKAVLQKWRKYRLSQLNKNWGSSPVAPLSSVQSLSLIWLFATPWTTPCQASLSITNSRGPPKPMFIESVMPFNHLILCHPLLLLPSIFPSIRVFSNESALQLAKVLEFQLQHQSFQWTPRTDLL